MSVGARVQGTLTPKVHATISHTPTPSSLHPPVPWSFSPLDLLKQSIVIWTSVNENHNTFNCIPFLPIFCWLCFMCLLSLLYPYCYSTAVSPATPCNSCKYVLLEMVGIPLADVRAVGDKFEWVDESDSWGVTVSPDVHWVLTLGQTWATLDPPPLCTLDVFGIHGKYFFCAEWQGEERMRGETNSLGRDWHGLMHCRLKWWTVVS